MRKLSVLVIFALALHAGTACADTKRAAGLSAGEIKHLTELKETAAKNRAKVKKLVKQQTRALRGKRRPRGKR